MPFLTNLTLQPSHGHLWKLAMPLVYRDALHGDITVYPGAITDGASVPRPLWSIVGSPLRDTRVVKAAAIHDQLYKTLGAGLTRKQCDQVFCRALRDEGVSWVKAATYYIGVRIGGWIGWRRYARDHDALMYELAFINRNTGHRADVA